MNMNNNMVINMNLMNMNDIMNLQQEFNNNLNKIELLKENIINMYDCFEYNQKIYGLIGENQMYCEMCKHMAPFSFATRIYNTPEVLIIILDRELDIQSKVKLKFDFQLDLRNYIENPNCGYLYELISVITKIGESGINSHFIASCKSPINNIWYQYNDDFVFPITNFNQQILDFENPYILFYKKTQ